MNENVRISIEISLKFVPKGPINNIPALVQVMACRLFKGPINNIPALVQVVAWRQTGDKPLSEAMLTQFTEAYMRH